MKHYRRIWSWVVIGLFVYMIAGFLSFDVSKKKSNEVFPIFSWFLFAEIPQKTHERYTIKIYKVNGQDLSEPIFFSEATGFVDPKSVSANKLLQDLGKAIEWKDDRMLGETRRVLESNQIHQVDRYELVKMTYDPVERYKTGKMQIDSIRFFEKGK